MASSLNPYAPPTADALVGFLTTLSDDTPREVRQRALDVASQVLVDVILGKDANDAQKITSEIRAVLMRWRKAADDETAGRLTQLLATAVAASQRLLSPRDVEILDEGTHAYRMLRLVAEAQEKPNQELVDELDIEASQVSRAGRALVDRGFLSKTRAGRNVWWAVTDRGEEALQRAPGARSAENRQPAGNVRRGELADPMSVIGRMTDLGSTAGAGKSLQAISRAATAAFIADGGGAELHRRLSIWQSVRDFGGDALNHVDFRVLGPQHHAKQHRALFWSTLHECSAHGNARDFVERWPLPEPIYDALVVVHGAEDRRGLVLVDSRVSPDEFREPPFRLRSAARQQELSRLLRTTREAIGPSSAHAWKQYPDAAMRLAFLHALRDFADFPVWHLNLYFVASGSRSPLAGVAPRSEDAWLPVIDRIRHGYRLDTNVIGQMMRREFVLDEPNANAHITGQVHTVHREGRWLNRIEGETVVVASNEKHAVILAGGRLAKDRGVEHVIHDTDDSVDEHHHYLQADPTSS